MVSSGQADHTTRTKQEIAAGRDANVAGRDLSIINYYVPPDGAAARTARAESTAADIDPGALGVHEAIGGTRLPPYVRRDHDDLLDALLDPDVTASRVVVLKGGSSAGKSRSAYQAVSEGPLASWCLECPLIPGELIRLLDAGVAERTVLWLGELRHFVDADCAQEALARLARFLRRTQQVIVVTTAWEEHWSTYTRDHHRIPGEPDPFVAARALLTGLPEVARLADVDPSRGGVIDVAVEFSASELERTSRLADPSLDEALKASALAGDTGRVAQYLAGVPNMLRHWEDPGGDPYGRALITAAIDFARLAESPICPPDFLRQAVTGYLNHEQRTEPIDSWLGRAFTYASERLRGEIRSLAPVPPEHGTGIASYQLADYLDQHGRIARGAVIPPSTFWEAATQLPLDRQAVLGHAAKDRGLLRVAAQLYKNTISIDSTAPVQLAKLMLSIDPDDMEPAEWIARHVPLRESACIGSLLETLVDADADPAVRALLERNPEDFVDVSDDSYTWWLADALSYAGAGDRVRALLDREHAARGELGGGAGPDTGTMADPAKESNPSVPDEPWFGLYGELGEEWKRKVLSLIERDPARHVDRDVADAVTARLRALGRAEADGEFVWTAVGSVAQADISNPGFVALLLDTLIEVGAKAHVIELIGRDPAGKANLRDPVAVGDLLKTLRKLDADTQVAALVARDPGQHAILGSGGFGADYLMRELYDVGAITQADLLLEKLPAIGAFEEFCEYEDSSQIFRYGREPDGSSANRWGWTDIA